MCVACYTCSQRCPRGIELTDRLWPALRDRAMQEGHQPPAELQETFQNIFKYGNTLGKSPRQRLDWAKGLDVPVLDLSKDRRPVDVLWLVGCYPSYYPRNQGVARAFARILTALGVSWGVLGTKEKAIGECDRMFGEEGLFETLVEENSKLLNQQEFGKLVVLGSARLPGAAGLLSAVRRLVPGPALHDVPCRAARAAEAAGGPAHRGPGDVSRQLLHRPPLRLLRSAAVAAAADPRVETGGDGPQSRRRVVLRRRGGRDVAGRPHHRPTAATACRTNGSVRPPTPGPRSWPCPALTSCRGSRMPRRWSGWKAS